jgi:hypothetical protein
MIYYITIDYLEISFGKLSTHVTTYSFPIGQSRNIDVNLCKEYTSGKEPTQQKHSWDLYENAQIQLLQFNCLKEMHSLTLMFANLYDLVPVTNSSGSDVYCIYF